MAHSSKKNVYADEWMLKANDTELVMTGDRHNSLWVFNRDAIQLYDRSGKSILRTQRGRYPPEEEELHPPPSVLRLRPSAGDGHEDRGMEQEEKIIG